MKRNIYKAFIAAAASVLVFCASSRAIVNAGLLISRVDSSSILNGSYTIYFYQSGLIWIYRTDRCAKVVVLPTSNSGKRSRQPQSVLASESESSLREPVQDEHTDQTIYSDQNSREELAREK